LLIAASACTAQATRGAMILAAQPVRASLGCQLSCPSCAPPWWNF